MNYVEAMMLLMVWSGLNQLKPEQKWWNGVAAFVAVWGLPFAVGVCQGYRGGVPM